MICFIIKSIITLHFTQRRRIRKRRGTPFYAATPSFSKESLTDYFLTKKQTTKTIKSDSLALHIGRETIIEEKERAEAKATEVVKNL